MLEVVIAHDRAYAQYLIDKWFWRCWLLFAVVTGFAMDYLMPVGRWPVVQGIRRGVVVGQFLASLAGSVSSDLDSLI